MISVRPNPILMMMVRPILALTLARVIPADPSSAQSMEKQHSWASFLEEKAARPKDGLVSTLPHSQLIVGFVKLLPQTDFNIFNFYLYLKNFSLLNKNQANLTENSLSKEQSMHVVSFLRL